MTLDNLQHHALLLDAHDTLAAFKNEFYGTPEIYLDGNSLGKLPIASKEYVYQTIDHQWGQGMIRSWGEEWIDLPNKIATKIAQVVGADSDEIFICDNTSINLYKLAFAALQYQSGRKKILTDEYNFPTDQYIIQGLLKTIFTAHTLQTLSASNNLFVEESEYINSIDHHTALVIISHVLYKSGYMYDMKTINDAARSTGALVLWDLSHATGAVPLQLHEWNTDIAVGCTYKYLNGGPGSPAFLYIRKSLQDKFINPIWGWFGHQKPFEFSGEYNRIESIQSFATGTPGILSLAPLNASLDIHLKAGIEQIRTKSITLTNYFLNASQSHLAAYGFESITPADEMKRGSHISIRHKEAYRIYLALLQPQQQPTTVIIPDYRPPDLIRIGIAPLYNQAIELYTLTKRLIDIIETKEYLLFSNEKNKLV